MAEFDKFAKDFRTLHNQNLQFTGFNTFYFLHLKMQWLQRYEENAPLQVLDFGCGDGYTEEYMHSYFPNWQVQAIDVSAHSIAEAKKRNAPNAVFSCFNGSKLMFEDDSFDVVFIACVFHHIPTKQHATLLKEIHRVLKKGGRVYMFEHNVFNPLTKYLVKTCAFDENAILQSAGYFKKIFKQQKLIPVVTNYLIFFPGWRLFKPLLRLEKYLSWLPLGGQYLIKAVK